MGTKVISRPRRLAAIAVAFGLALAAGGAAIAQAATANPAAPSAAAPMPAWAQGFVCHARPGGWCDLRDWRGFGQEPAPQQAAAPPR